MASKSKCPDSHTRQKIGQSQQLIELFDERFPKPNPGMCDLVIARRRGNTRFKPNT